MAKAVVMFRVVADNVFLGDVATKAEAYALAGNASVINIYPVSK